MQMWQQNIKYGWQEVSRARIRNARGAPYRNEDGDAALDRAKADLEPRRKKNHATIEG